MSTGTEPTNTINNQTPASIGVRLTAARDAKNLSQQQVADQLRLNIKFIIMMEDENFPADLPLTFVRGYIRSYAKLLEIPEADVTRGLEPIKPVEIEPDIEPAVKEIAPVTSGNYYMQFVSALIAFTIIGLVVISWWSHSKTPQQVPIIAETISDKKVETAPSLEQPNHAAAAPGEDANSPHTALDATIVNPSTITPVPDKAAAIAAVKPLATKSASSLPYKTKVPYSITYVLLFILAGLCALFYHYKSILRPAFAEPYNVFKTILLALGSTKDDRISALEEPLPDFDAIKKLRLCLMLITMTLGSLGLVGWINYQYSLKNIEIMAAKTQPQKATPYTPVTETSTVTDSLLNNIDQDKISADSMTQKTENTAKTGQMTELMPLDVNKYSPLPQDTFAND